MLYAIRYICTACAGAICDEDLQPGEELCVCEALAPLLHHLPHTPAWTHPSRGTPPLAAPGGLSLSELLSTAPPLYAGGGSTQEEVCRVAIPLHISKQPTVHSTCPHANCRQTLPE